MSKEKFALVEWLGENLFSVAPLCCSKDPAKCKAGACMDFKWGDRRTPKKPAKYYKTLILKISDDRRSLKELEDQIVNGELSPDDVTDSVQLEEEEVIDSTTPEKQDFKEKQASKLMTPMRTLPSHSSMKRSLDWINEDSHPHLPKRSPTPQSDEWSPASSPGNGGVISSKVKMSGGKNSFQVNVACSDAKPSAENEIEKKDRKIQSLNIKLQNLESMIRKQVAAKSKLCEMESNKMEGLSPGPQPEKELKREAKGKFPLVPGYSALVSQPQLDEVVDCSDVLAASSCFGSRKFPQLDKDIVLACLKFVMQKYPVSRSVLVDAINDKCANYRRKRKSA